MDRLKAFFVFCFFAAALNAGAQSLKERLSSIRGITYTELHSLHFKEYYEVVVDQPVDHTSKFSAHFRQRIYIGFNSFDSVTVMDTDGYGIGYAQGPGYENELAALLGGNLIKIEHRYFGASVPDSMDYTFLNTSQAAADVHAIRMLFAAVFTGKWISTGISKGGQAVLAHRILYPDDVSFSVLYSTPVKKSLYDPRIEQKLSSLSATACGRKLAAYQDSLLNNKTEIEHLLEMYAKKNQLTYRYDTETTLDYLVLELPFSFWQNGGKCGQIPENNSGPSLFEYLTTIIPPSFYSESSLKGSEPAFYMSYHELGYYEYKTERFRGHLKAADFSNRKFIPAKVIVSFDPVYLNNLNDFLQTKRAGELLFIYGEQDPWSALQDTGNATKVVIRNGSHKSRISDMPPEQRADALQKIRKAIQ